MESSPFDLVEHRDTVELPPKPHLEDILYALRRILTKPLIQKIVIEKKKPIEVVWHGPKEDTLDFDLPDPDPADAVRNLELEELVSDGSPEELLGKATLFLESRGLCISHAVVGTKTLLWSWLKIDLGRLDVERPRYLMGGRIVGTKQYPDYLLILVGGPSSTSSLDEALAAVKIVMEIKKGETGQGT